MFKLATVFYNPTLEDIEYFKGLSNSIDVVAYVNSPVIDADYGSLYIIGDGVNVGLSRALNEIYSKFDDDCCLLYLDQDSRITLDDILLLYDESQCYESNSTIIVPLISSDKGESCIINDLYWRFPWGISSGMIATCGLVKRVGFFRDDYFIDRIDFEFFFRAYKSGVNIHCANEVRLNQVFGAGQQCKRYSAVRNYYQGRNAVLFSIRDSRQPLKGFLFLVILLLKRFAVGVLRFSPKETYDYLRGVLAGVKCLWLSR